MIQWSHYPKSSRPTKLMLAVAQTFESVQASIDSTKHKLDSNGVLELVGPHLATAGFRVESGKKKADKITVPVLFGRNGRVEKSFEADAFHPEEAFVVEVEAGRGVTNNQFLKDLFQACMMQDVRYLGIAVRRDYLGNRDFDTVCTFFDTLYASGRLPLPLVGVLVIGY